MTEFKKEVMGWFTYAAIAIVSPSKWPAVALKLSRFLLARAVILIYCAILFFLIAGSRNLQIIGVFQEVSQSWVQVLTSGITALCATIMFAVRKPHCSIITRYFDFPLYLAPLFIIVLAPPWGELSWVWSFAVLAGQITLMVQFIQKTLWEKQVSISALLGFILISFGVLYFVTLINPVDFGRTVSVVILVTLFVGLILTMIAALLRWPGWAFASLVWAVVVFGSGFEFRHEARYHSLPDYELINYGTADPFALWLFDRPDADFYRQNGLPYPVFLISSAGGGGYAKAHAYSFLSEVSDRCPNFAQHIFALVGVSGGQIGNTMYHSHLNMASHEDVSPCVGTTQSSHARYLAADNLSPLVAHLLFVETPRKFLLLGPAQRGRSEVLTDSFNGGGGYGPMADIPFREHFWSYNLNRSYAAELTGKPALVSVTTNVETGNRYVFSPFRFSTRAQSHLDFFRGAGDMDDGTADLVDPALSSAAVASASFPWVTPSLRFSWERGFNELRDQPDATVYEALQNVGPVQSGAVNLVDGGYFDNSGAETMSEILADLSDEGGFLQCGSDPDQNYFGVSNDYRARSFPSGSPCTSDENECLSIETRFVAHMGFGVEWGRCEMPFLIANIIIRDTATVTATGGSQNFIMDPLNAMLNARGVRGDLAVATLEERKCGFHPDLSSCWANADATGSGDPYPQFWSGVFQSRINSSAMRLPLGWHMPLDRMEVLEDWVAPSDAVCEEVGIPLFEETEIYDFDLSSDYAPEIDLLLKRNCSHLRQIGLYFDIEALRLRSEWMP